MEWIEPLAVVTALICVWLNTQENAWGWVLAIVSAVLYVVLLYDKKLWANVGLQVAFILISVYGLYRWQHPQPEKRQIQRTSWALVGVFFASFLVLSVLIQAIIVLLNEPIAPLDVATTAASLVAQSMMARKYIEHWWVWVVTNVAYVFLYAQSGLWLSMGLYVIFTFLAIWGYLQWQRNAVDLSRND